VDSRGIPHLPKPGRYGAPVIRYGLRSHYRTIAFPGGVASLDRRKVKPASDEDPPILLFEHQKAWEDWLSRNHLEATGVWLRIAKKGSKIRSLTHAEALDSALCFGWIDAQKKPESASAWLERFTPRGRRSIWSKLNRQKATALIECGRMRDSGLQEVLRANKDGRWEQAYDSPRNATVPEDFQAALDKSARAKAFFATLESRNRYAILFRIQTVKKAETRARKISEFVAMLEKHEKIHP
jgi:uncharacterized protein YdeI (YjbR/CyaY-like superfamily)